ncbi:hypothetical protein Ocin01_12810 [Orchesella cincta]|uniref:Uncharacterized protein n=1 Tax=Orchesella cincta TaxID=48709 RepID=A0A1D2MLK5_ORCCI|nr:hypothetical protein Ocin01_12810 [Orchesella cincta]
MGVFVNDLIKFNTLDTDVVDGTNDTNYGAAKDFDDEFVIIESKSNNSINAPATETILIQYFHTPAEENIIFTVTLLQMLVQFLSTSETLAAAGNSFFAGYEFVRRSGTMLCRNSHQRRLIQSLEWSFSSTNPSVMSANSFFTIDRQTILGAFTAVAGFFSLIIQLQVDTAETKIQFVNLTACKAIGDSFELVRGECVGNQEKE